jgi:2-polyprenyl-6-methoxyphenol hydroxylase-like FAD-dependent oxidoreductase
MTIAPSVGTVLISGAGVAGPTLAYWLRRYGFTPTVVEMAPGLRPGGQTVDLRGAGRTIIERMGLMAQARERCLSQQGIAYVDATGKHLAEMTVADFDGDGIVSELEILRGDLCELVYEPTADEVEYLFGRHLVALQQDPGGVHVEFDDGTTRTFDLVVGADGPHSGVRRLAFGPEEEFAKPLGGYTAWFTAPDEVGLDGWYEMYNEPGGLVVSLRPDTVPGQAKAGLSFTSPPISYDRGDVAAQRRLLTDRFAGAGWQAKALLRAAATADDFYFDAINQVRMDRWSDGRVALVGDAGYCPSPLTGMGTSLGLVGAYVLAGELALAGGDHARAFAGYETTMRPYVTNAQQLPPGGIKGYAPTSNLTIRSRTFSTKLMVSRPLRGLVKRLFFSRAEAIDLPDYPAVAGLLAR